MTAHESLGRLLEEVRLARTRLVEGSYGRCAVCGGPIPEGRLGARPWATTCLRHG
ncbi:TraR/DksA family transcriptional regulator [Ornithinimicrobium kibberense]|uniref:TraR/DksA family transcriptional regulator n=1 Tax=Ornithinimicrobium kibberense TaxID=282060 RepID=UPI00361725E8